MGRWGSIAGAAISPFSGLGALTGRKNLFGRPARHDYPFAKEFLPGIRTTSEALQANVLGNMNRPDIAGMSWGNDVVPRSVLSDTLTSTIRNPEQSFGGLASMLSDIGSGRQANLGLLGSPIAEHAISRSLMQELAPLVASTRDSAIGRATDIFGRDTERGNAETAREDLISRDRLGRTQSANDFLRALISGLGIGGQLPADEGELARIMKALQGVAGAAGGAMSGGQIGGYGIPRGSL